MDDLNECPRGSKTNFNEGKGPGVKISLLIIHRGCIAIIMPSELEQAKGQFRALQFTMHQLEILKA